ncbi:PilZ domain-containing protein [Psychrobacter sp. I-STPA10]|uniref:PilZ domain-containing protein n=1 Tax=Psychrobacter sp. I-STPA10 TaxID=2585769 RepID=UPI001E327B83|nr:PilZ domain-containing protein [Psychrobacter sp. I-STPA10]
MALPSGRGGIITCHIEDLETLYASYLPFVNNGAVFIPSNQQYQLGDDVFVAVTLPGSSERMPLNGKVVWVNIKAQANRPAGFAVQFGTDAPGIRMKNEMERLLAGKADSALGTYTM